jgi:hypothetical protein
MQYHQESRVNHLTIIKLIHRSKRSRFLFFFALSEAAFGRPDA